MKQYMLYIEWAPDYKGCSDPAIFSDDLAYLVDLNWTNCLLALGDYADELPRADSVSLFMRDDTKDFRWIWTKNPTETRSERIRKLLEKAGVAA